MLTLTGEPDAGADTAFFEALRAREFARLDEAGIAYLDYAGAGQYAASQIEAHDRLLRTGLFGNPHAESAPSRASTSAIEAAREATLRLFGVDASTHTVCFTANTSAAAKLVAESFPFGPSSGLLLTCDNHNSINGLRQYARAACAPVNLLGLDQDLRLADPVAQLEDASRSGPGLFAFPAQSNFSGVRHDLSLVARAQARGWRVLLDAAGLPASCLPDLKQTPADFTAVSFYKLFGLPGGVGALVARNEALAALSRPWFAGGTVGYVSVQAERARLSPGPAAFEDGTPDFLGLAALKSGFALLDSVPRERRQARLAAIGAAFLADLLSLTHPDGSPLVRLYGPAEMVDRGPTFAFNLLDRDGGVVPYPAVEDRAREAGVALRGGCFCNPGAAEAAFGFEAETTARCFDSLGDRFTIPRFAACLGEAATVGAVRISLGLPTVDRDLDRALALIAGFAEHGRTAAGLATAS